MVGERVGFFVVDEWMVPTTTELSLLDAFDVTPDGFEEGRIVDDAPILHGATAAHASGHNSFSPDSGRKLGMVQYMS